MRSSGPRALTVVNSTLAIVLIAAWASVFVVKGIVGATAWGLAILILAPLGAVLVLASLTFLVVGVSRHKPVAQRAITLVLSCILAIPLLTLLNLAPMVYPATAGNTHPSLTIVSPFKRDVIVGSGGDNIRTNASHLIWASERWAYDLVAEPYDTGDNRLADFGIYGLDVYSPVAGMVIAAHDGEPDITPNKEEFTSLAGNYVYVRLKIDDADAYLLLTHLKNGSVKVAAGDSVAVGDHLAQVGNSGTSSEPHLHIHLQRQDPTKTLYPVFAEGLPLYFSDRAGGRTLPSTGTILGHQ